MIIVGMGRWERSGVRFRPSSVQEDGGRAKYEVRDSNFGDPVFWVFGLSDTAVCAHLEKHAAKQANQNTSVNNRPPSNYHK